MLKNVHLKNLALIKESDIDLEKGLNIMTGETGAGKSIIIGSINIALGDKASKSFIRNGTDYGLVELLFESRDERVFKLLDSLDIPRDENHISVTRKITADSSTTRINGVSVTLSNLRSITSLLVDIHGQHDHQSLLDPAKHLEIIDEFAGSDLTEILARFRSEYNEHRKLRRRFKQFEQDPAAFEKELSLIRFEINEIEEAGLKPGEDEALEEEYKKLSNAEKICEGLSRVRSLLFESNENASAGVSDSLKEIGYLTASDPDLKIFSDYLMDIESIFRDMNHELSHYIDSNSFNEERYHKVHERLNEINRLKSKYGHTIEDILAYQDSLTARVEEMNNYADNKAVLMQEIEQVKAAARKDAHLLSEKRQESARQLEDKIKSNLKDLNFQDVRFEISFSTADKIYESGFDKVEFLISTNIGEPVKPLVKVASGGELSRIMLAIKASIADQDRTDTLIFDEIDTGISGHTAQKVAEKLRILSYDHQLICITHLPQIAAMADSHYLIEKSVSEGSTISGIHKLREADSILEIARLLSGSEITENTIRNAEEMKEANRRSL